MDAKTVSLLSLDNPEWNSDSRIAAVSLPVPMNAKLPTGLAGVASQSVDIAWWPDSQSKRKRAPRRRLLFALANEELPREFRLGKPTAAPRGLEPVDARIRIVNEDLDAMLPHKVGEVVFRWKGRSLAVRPGIRWKKELHWLQWPRIEELWSGPLVKAVRIGGYIEVDSVKEKEFRSKKTFFGSERLHRHDWLFAEMYVLCFSNGIVHVTARHVNNHRFDEGRALEHLVPVLGLVPDKSVQINETIDGFQNRFDLGSVALNFSDSASMVSAEHPGSLTTEDGIVVYQPYEGVEVEGGSFRGGRPDKFRVKAHERQMPKGVARTVRFCFSLGEASPEIGRLVVPEWWYALSADMWPDDALPVRNELDARIERTYESVVTSEKRGRFDDSVVGWSWEGESPYAGMLYFYRSGQLAHLRRALRDAYHIADIAFDHSTETIRMTDYPFDGAIAPPLFRTVGLTFGYLETGDPYLLECAESATTHWYWIDRHNWPRFAFGRDGASIRGLIFLWDYTGKEDYLTMAREAIGRLIQCQNPDGSYHDQGGTTGVHSIGQVVKKPWMANLATDPILDYLLRRPDDSQLWRAVEKTAGFMMATFQRGKDKGYWPYQVAYGKGRYDPWIHHRNPKSNGRLPFGKCFAHGHKARLLNVMSRRTGKSRYFETWLEFFHRYWKNETPNQWDYHVFDKTIQHLTFAQAHSWNARWCNNVLCIHPLRLAKCPELEGTILTPAGCVTLKVRWAKKRFVIVERSGADVPIELKS